MPRLRSPETAAELRSTVHQYRDESGIKPRAKRNRLLYRAMDDDMVAEPRTWKRYRTSKYRKPA